MMTLTFLVLALAPLAAMALAFLVGLLLSTLHTAAPVESTMGDAQEWADTLSLELDVDAEWARMSDEAVRWYPIAHTEAEVVDILWTSTIECAHIRLDIVEQATARRMPRKAKGSSRKVRHAAHTARRVGKGQTREVVWV